MIKCNASRSNMYVRVMLGVKINGIFLFRLIIIANCYLIERFYIWRRYIFLLTYSLDPLISCSIEDYCVDKSLNPTLPFCILWRQLVQPSIFYCFQEQLWSWASTKKVRSGALFFKIFGIFKDNLICWATQLLVHTSVNDTAVGIRVSVKSCCLFKYATHVPMPTQIISSSAAVILHDKLRKFSQILSRAS